jgi:hypothetical protein
MEPQNDPPATPKDATKTTEEQREIQDEFDRRNEDPGAHGSSSSNKSGSASGGGDE